MYKQIELPYSFDALEPSIDTLTMQTHYGKHHAAYTKTLNEAAEKAGVADWDIETLLASLDKISDEALRTTIRNNGGGYYNHNLYFSILSPNPLTSPEGLLKEAIERDFGNLENVKAALKKAALGRFGSGWAWLNTDRDGKLSISSSANQDNPLSEGKKERPILAIDVWEHAYYLKYKNVRADYVDAFFSVLDWKQVAENYKNIVR